MTSSSERTVTFTTSTSDTSESASSHRTLTPPEITPASSLRPENDPNLTTTTRNLSKMDGVKSEAAAGKEQQPGDRIQQEPEIKTETTTEQHKSHGNSGEGKVAKCCARRHHKNCKRGKSKKSKKEDKDSSSSSSSSSESSSSDSESDEEDSDTEDSSSEDEKAARRRRRNKKQKKKSKRRSKRDVSSDEDEEEDAAESPSEEEVRYSKKRSSRKVKKSSRRVEESTESEAASDESDQADARTQLKALSRHNRRGGRGGRAGGGLGRSSKGKKIKSKTARKGSSSKPAYFRGDELWDREIHDYRLTPTSERVDEDDYGDYVFHVRRRFDWEGKYTDVSFLAHTVLGCGLTSWCRPWSTLSQRLSEIV